MNPDSSDLRYIMEKILILDFGSQYTQLIARRVRELSVYCEIHPFNKIPALDASVRGVILSGSPFSVRDENAPTPDLSAIKGKLPLLGVCYGAQFLASAFGGEVQPAPSREYGRAMLTVGDADDALMRGLPKTTQVWMSHGDTITSVPANYKIVASTEDVRVAAFHVEGEQTWGIQFHPEVYHSTDGTQLLKNFVAGICGCKQEWTSESFVEATVRELREKLGDDKVVLGLSGGVDSSVAAVLLHKAIGKNLYCIFVDSGLLRKNEFEDVLESYKNMGLNVKGVKAGDKVDGASSGTLAVIYDLSYLELEMAVDELDIGKVEVGQEVRITADALEGQTFSGVVDKVSINGTTANGATSYPVTIIIEDYGDLRPGMNVSAQIIGEVVPNALCIPVDAVERGNTVTVPGPGALSEDGLSVVDVTKLETKEVTLGRNDDEYIEVTDGLEEGDVVLISNQASSLMDMMMGG